ncbi:molybdopterin-binding domain-containing protein [Alienimonas californiensis]|uniref:Uncharacterized protein n=1 Tax=Alienimonas californiensis TaxID=2527989 RepID=A0A517P9N7_9PLAN|nr:hypothetical protein [Alienimonas californiensis]QDT16088.1 hypothetical protein CA12_21860 [Alienimonas californiensis]
MVCRFAPTLFRPTGLALLTGLAVVAAGATSAPSALAQGGRESGGFDSTLPSIATGAEIRSQADLWVMQVDFKPMRLAALPVTDPDTGETARELVWYLVWRATNRPLQSPEKNTARTPQNRLDPPPAAPPFVPEFVLIAEDGGATQYRDVILPGALPVIENRELRGAFADVKLNTTVSASGDLPAGVAADAPPGEGAVYGVATWKGVDPTTDRFTVLLNGFSNGYRIVDGPDGQPVTERRTGVLKFWRPGDEIDEVETEFRLGVDPRGDVPSAAGVPHWEYLPDEAVDADGEGDVSPEAVEGVRAEAVGGFGEN